MVLQCIRDAGLTLTHEKCRFGQRSLKILGHLMDKDGIRPDPGKVEAIREFPTPKPFRKNHQDADCLPRSPLLKIEEHTEDIPFLNTITSFESEQNKDPEVANIRNEMVRKRDSSKFKEFNGTLYRKIYDPLGKQWLLFIQKHLREDALKSLHDAPTAGHLGFAKIYDRIRRKYFWPGLYRSVQRYVSHCRECQRRKSQPQ
ncbi:transposon Ty3-I Gag-Pol polyprotein [Trichonephila inaurata madagascariensis]|uniref:RNA-directed DNA polymerase n=1 Tax=Trichonephila inaurata madagascariensis TaxID=2747483 RepID=A0A8X6XR42_9ARAC|nr:transposon Ty3-I Gag-Pol polyprotein [Trichonephila inaurata madagascariensis]